MGAWLERTNITLIQGIESDNAHELVKVTRDNMVVAVASPVSNPVTAWAVKGQEAAPDHGGTNAVAARLRVEPVKWNAA